MQSLEPANASFEIKMIHRVSSADDALKYLRALEKNNRLVDEAVDEYIK